MEFIEQFLDILNIDQVDKSVSDIAVILNNPTFTLKSMGR